MRSFLSNFFFFISHPLCQTFFTLFFFDNYGQWFSARSPPSHFLGLALLDSGWGDCGSFLLRSFSKKGCFRRALSFFLGDPDYSMPFFFLLNDSHQPPPFPVRLLFSSMRSIIALLWRRTAVQFSLLLDLISHSFSTDRVVSLTPTIHTFYSRFESEGAPRATSFVSSNPLTRIEVPIPG